MEVIEKVTRDGDTQIFEIITSRKELAEWLRDALWESIYSEYAESVYNDVDTTTCYYDKDGKFYWIAEGEEVKRPNVSKIEKLYQVNGGTIVIYGNVPIVYNEHYGDWEVDFD